MTLPQLTLRYPERPSPDPVTAVTPDGINYTFSVSPTTDGTVLVDIGAGAARDEAGNPSTAATQFSITYDSTLQRTDITSVQSGPTNVATINFEIDFVNAVTGFDHTDIDLSDSTAPNGGVANFAGADGATSYTFDVTATGDGNVTVDIAASAGTYVGGTDTTDEATYTVRYDGTAPGPTVNSTQHPGPTNEATVLFWVNFTEPVNGFAAGDVTVAGVGGVTLTGGIQNFVNVNGSHYTFQLTPDGDGTIRVDVPADGAADDAGNNNTAAVRYTIEYDDQAPYTRITSVQSGPTGARTINFEVGFGEEVRDFEQGGHHRIGGRPAPPPLPDSHWTASTIRSA